MKSQTAIAIGAGLLVLPLVQACTQTRYVYVPQGTTPPVTAQVPVSTLQPVYCVVAPPGYVIQQDKWDPHLVPCPPRRPAVRTGGGGGDGGTPGTPEEPRPPRAPAYEGSVIPDGPSAEMGRDSDGNRYEESRIGDLVAREVYR